MFKFPTKLDDTTLRNVFNHPMYRRLLINSSRLRQNAKSRGVFARLGMQIV